MSETSIMGTARYVGMSGAMSAIGGDPTAAMDNPAGLGLYRRMEATVSLGVKVDDTRQVGLSSTHRIIQVTVPQASLVLSVPTMNTGDEGVLFHNFMFSYRNAHSYSRNMYGTNVNDASLGAILAGLKDVNWDIPFCSDPYTVSNSLKLSERGYVNHYAFQWAMNWSNRVFVGAGLQIQSYLLSSDAEYLETFARLNDSGAAYYNRNISTLVISGTTCSFNAGVIYRPLGWLRLGFGIHTPSLGGLNRATTGTLRAMTDSLRSSYAPDTREPDKDFHLPMRTTTSLAFQIGAYGMAALQYDFTHAKFMDNVHTLRAGFEVIPVLGLYINGGYAIESTFKRFNYIVPVDPYFERQDTYYPNTYWTQYVSAAVGYRGTYMMIQAAYQYRWQHMDLYAHENAQPYDLNTSTHRVVITIGWHRN